MRIAKLLIWLDENENYGQKCYMDSCEKAIELYKFFFVSSLLQDLSLQTFLIFLLPFLFVFV